MNYRTLLNATFAANLIFATSAFADGHTRSTEQVLTAHLTAFGSGNVDAIMQDYNDDSVIVTPLGALEGTDAIRGLFVALVTEFSKPGMTFSLDTTHINGDFAYIIWTAETADNVYEYATDTFFIDDGKIVFQTVAFKATPK